MKIIKSIFNFIKTKYQQFLADRRERHYREGFEFGMVAYHLYGHSVSEIVDTISKKPDSFDMGVLRAIQIINREE